MFVSYLEKVAQENQLMWPYEVDYDKCTNIQCDVLVIGGGMSGCFAAINAAKRGAKVVVMDKGSIRRSGSAGAGIDHWGGAFGNPDSPTTPEDTVKHPGPPHTMRHGTYVGSKEAFWALMEMEEYGVQVRDEHDEFADAPFRDEKTKMLYAYDYAGKATIRFFGKNLKPALYKEMKRLGIHMLERTMGTSLLSEGGKNGATVIGGTGINIRTGEFYVVNSKATVLATAKPLRLWDFSTELVGSNAAHDDPNNAGDGDVMAYRAGAKLMMMERTSPSSGGKRYPAYGTGNAHNTWWPCSIIDATGKYIPWVDRDGNVLETVEQRNQPAPGQKSFGSGPAGGGYESKAPELLPTLSEAIKSGEYKLPFYADLGDLPDYERRAIFGLMLGNEGKTYIPIIKNLTNAGFDPAKDMLQANVLPVNLAGSHQPWWDVKHPGLNGPGIRETAFMAYGGLVVDWKMMSSVEGLFAVGNQMAGGTGVTHAAGTGRYCGRVLATYIKDKELIPVCETQVAQERQRIYRPTKYEGRTFGWKEIQLGLCRIMQDYMGAVITKEVLDTGLWWMNSIRNHELAKTKANNPHELGKILECDVRLTVGEIIMNQALLREESCRELGFNRLDFPEQGNNKGKYITISQEDGKVIRGELPFEYWLKGDNEADYLANYKKYACLEEGEK